MAWWAHQDLNLGPTDYECVLGSGSEQPTPTNIKKNLGKEQAAFGLGCSLSAGVFGQHSDSGHGVTTNREHPKHANQGWAQRVADPFIHGNCLILRWKTLAVRELSVSLEEIPFGIYGR
ncbi:MAG: hypothetical protein ABSF14_23375 [Terriglobia bacterium]